MAQKLEAQGGKGGELWNDGSEYEAVTKILVAVGGNGIQNVKFYYVKEGQTIEGSLRGVVPRTDVPALTFVIKHPEEYLISVEGWYSSEEGLIHGIIFKTNKYDSRYMGVAVDKAKDTYFIVQDEGKKIVGFHGFSNNYLKSIGAYVVPVPPKIQETKWDDGSHPKVKKVQLTFDDMSIRSIQVTYDRAGLQSPLRGTVGPKSAEFTLDSDEYITALYGHRETSTQNVITALTFTTNKMCYGQYGNKSESRLSSVPFSAPEVPGEQISGFHGSSSKVLNSIGFHYAPVPAHKEDAEGGTRETEWDDGSDHEGVTKIYSRSDANGIQLVKFDYVKGGQLIQGPLHGVQGNSRGSMRQFAINHPQEYLVLVEGWYDSSNVIMGIQFKTNLDVYHHIGYDMHGDDTKFTLQVQDKKIIGFHGFVTNRLTSIGAHFIPLAPTPPSPKLKKFRGFGGDGGTSWDDGGAFDGVRKVFVGQTTIGIGAVEFVYGKGDAEIFGDEHGKRIPMGGEEFVLQYPEEYIIEVKGFYDKIAASKTEVMNTLKFITNIRTYGPFGPEAGEPFTLKLEGHKIVGFHGSSTDRLHKIGVYVIPITN